MPVYNSPGLLYGGVNSPNTYSGQEEEVSLSSSLSVEDTFSISSQFAATIPQSVVQITGSINVSIETSPGSVVRITDFISSSADIVLPVYNAPGLLYGGVISPNRYRGQLSNFSAQSTLRITDPFSITDVHTSPRNPTRDLTSTVTLTDFTNFEEGQGVSQTSNLSVTDSVSVTDVHTSPRNPTRNLISRVELDDSSIENELSKGLRSIVTLRDSISSGKNQELSLDSSVLSVTDSVSVDAVHTSPRNPTRKLTSRVYVEVKLVDESTVEGIQQSALKFLPEHTTNTPLARKVTEILNYIQSGYVDVNMRAARNAFISRGNLFDSRQYIDSLDNSEITSRLTNRSYTPTISHILRAYTG